MRRAASEGLSALPTFPEEWLARSIRAVDRTAAACRVVAESGSLRRHQKLIFADVRKPGLEVAGGRRLANWLDHFVFHVAGVKVQ